MPLDWDAQQVEWFGRASAYGSFHQKLAAMVAPCLRPTDSLCDVGCGMGRLSLALAPQVARVTGIDVRPRAVEAMRAEAAARGLANVQAVLGDARRLAVPYDVVVMSFFGRGVLEMRQLLPWCRRRLVRVLNATVGGHLYPGKYRRRAIGGEALRAELKALGLPYECLPATLEFGQPLRDMAEAEAFVHSHSGQATAAEVEEFLKQHLQTTGREDWPFYLPNPKAVEVFIIDTGGEGKG